ncbi:MAG: helix-turn-helix domain-containing protein [Roseovarius sp.]
MVINITTFELLLRKNGLTQAALAERARLGVKTVGRVRRGEELRPANAQKIATALGISLEDLAAPPSRELEEKAEKRGGLDRIVADLDRQALNALTLTSMRYNIPENKILEIAPYLFSILAERSLKQRREKLETWKDNTLLAVQQGPKPHEEPALETISDTIWELYDQELASIEARDLSGGFTGVHPEKATEENPGHPYFTMLEELAGEAGAWVEFSGSSFDYTPCPFWSDLQFSAADEFLHPDDDADLSSSDDSNLICDGCVPLRDMPENLLKSGSGAERRAWIRNHPDYSRYLSDTNQVGGKTNPVASNGGGANA